MNIVTACYHIVYIFKDIVFQFFRREAAVQTPDTLRIVICDRPVALDHMMIKPGDV